MNQILVTEKLYVTPELKRKKKMYKFNFFLSVFLVCSLFSYYIYAEYDRNKNEEVSKEILASLELKYIDEEVVEEEETTPNNGVRMEGNVLIVTLNQQEKNRQEINITKLAESVQAQIEKAQEDAQIEKEVFTTDSGTSYTVDGILNIPSLEINYPIIDETSEELLKISLNKYWGGEPNTVGNYVIVGHNYKNKKMFGKLSQINVGDTVELTDLTGTTVTYEVYSKYVVDPTDTSCTSQLTNGNKEVTLITCTNYGTQRLVVKAREVK
jgi:LPXTG-site transpeptidase (sortase) family protein